MCSGRIGETIIRSFGLKARARKGLKTTSVKATDTGASEQTYTGQPSPMG